MLTKFLKPVVPIVLLAGCLSAQSGLGQAQAADSLRPVPVWNPSPYQLHTGRELTLLGVGAAAGATSLILEKRVEPLTAADVQMLNRLNVGRFDRRATDQYSHGADRLSDVTLAGTVVLGSALALGTRTMRQDFKTVAVMYVETLLLANGFQRITKNLTQRIRPFVYNASAPLDEKLVRDARQSFFSGHATNAFATAVFTGEVFRHYFPESRLKPLVWGGSLVLATTTVALGYKGGRHYPTDLLAGAAFGSLVGWGIPKLHEVKNQMRLGHRLDIQPWSSGPVNGLYARYRFQSTSAVFP